MNSLLYISMADQGMNKPLEVSLFRDGGFQEEPHDASSQQAIFSFSSYDPDWEPKWKPQ